MDPLVLMVPGEGVARLYWCIFVEPAGPDLSKGSGSGGVHLDLLFES
jgi:hypothetical protein